MDFSVFPSDKFPSGKPIAQGDSIEGLDIERFFSGRSRDEITLGLLQSSYTHDPAACLTFMLPDAFAFFLPAFMRIALEDFEAADAIPDSVIFDLLGLAEGRNQDRLDAVLSSYSPTQLRFVAEFLKQMSERYWHLYPSDDAKKAFSAYWGRFDKGKGNTCSS